MKSRPSLPCPQASWCSPVVLALALVSVWALGAWPARADWDPICRFDPEACADHGDGADPGGPGGPGPGSGESGGDPWIDPGGPGGYPGGDPSGDPSGDPGGDPSGDSGSDPGGDPAGPGGGVGDGGSDPGSQGGHALLPVPGTPATPIACADGGTSLTAAEVAQLLAGVASAIDRPLTVAVVDRAGRPLGLSRRGFGPEHDDQAVGLARTGAFFSHNQAPLSSRTVRYLSGIHFPPGIPNTPNAALYGIENTNRGCDLAAAFNPGQELPPARSVVHGGPCDASDTSGCGLGPQTGKADPFDGDSAAVDPGGLPIYRGPHLVGGLGVYVDDKNAAEFAAFTALTSFGLAPIPNPLPSPGVVFVDGIRLPFVEQIDRPAGVGPGSPATAVQVAGSFAGGCAPQGYLVGPLAGTHLSAAEVDTLVRQSIDGAQRTRAVIRLPLGSRTRMVIAVGDVDGRLLALYRMPDATVFSADVAAAKARNVVYYSADPGRLGLGHLAPIAITNRTVSFGAQPLFPPGIDDTGVGPFWNLFLADRGQTCSQGGVSPYRSGVVFFAGSLPLYRGNQLVGGLGISGDGVEQDDYVAFLGATGFLPPEAIWADQYFVDGLRLPFLKFPRNPEEP